MNIDLGNFSHKKIDAFTDIDGKECDFITYLKSHGLYASRCYLYLMTSMKGESSEDEDTIDDEVIDDAPSEVIVNPELENNMISASSTQSSPAEGGCYRVNEEVLHCM